MSIMNKPLKIRIRTEDRELIKELSAYLADKDAGDFQHRREILVFDSAEWQPVVEGALTFVIEASKDLTIGLIGAWLYDRFKTKAPEHVFINNQLTPPQQITIVVQNHIILQQGENSR